MYVYDEIMCEATAPATVANSFNSNNHSANDEGRQRQSDMHAYNSGTCEFCGNAEDQCVCALQSKNRAATAAAPTATGAIATPTKCRKF